MSISQRENVRILSATIRTKIQRWNAIYASFAKIEIDV